MVISFGRRALPSVVWLAGAVVALAAVPLSIRNQRTPGTDVAFVDAVVAVGVPLLGAVITTRAPRNRIGWVLLSTAGLGFAFATDAVATRWRLDGATHGGLAWVAWVSEWTWIPFLAMPSLLVLWFPTGRPVAGRGWRWVELAVVGLLGVVTIGSVLEPELGHHHLESPLGSWAPAWLTDARDGGVAAIAVLAVAGCWPSAVVRWRRASGDERQQLRWFVASLPLALAIFVACGVAGGPVADAASGMALVVIAAAIALAVLRHRLYELDIVVNRAVVLGLTGLLLTGAYAAASVAVDTAVGPRAGVVVAGLAVAFVLAPMRSLVQGAVDRLLFGNRADPYAALTRLGRRLADTTTPGGALAAASKDVAAALRVPSVELVDAAGHALAAYGAVGAPTDQPVPLFQHGRQVGTMLVGRRPSGPFGGLDRRLLADLAGQLGPVVAAATLTDDLRDARRRLVGSREDERQRLHRDLHDGLGPTLGAAVLTLDAARAALPPDAAVARERLDAAKVEMRTAVAEVRRVVHDLRPEALDELGLDGVVRRHAQALRHAGIDVRLGLPEPMPAMPAAVEVAAARIVGEALRNVARHAAAHTVIVQLDFTVTALSIEVVDDGVGASADPPLRGVGLMSMRDRAEELGGSFALAAEPGGGTSVRAILPIGGGE